MTSHELDPITDYVAAYLNSSFERRHSASPSARGLDSDPDAFEIGAQSRKLVDFVRNEWTEPSQVTRVLAALLHSFFGGDLVTTLTFAQVLAGNQKFNSCFESMFSNDVMDLMDLKELSNDMADGLKETLMDTRRRFQMAVDVGTSLGEVANGPLQQFAVPRISPSVMGKIPKGIKLQNVIAVLCRFAGVSFAMRLWRILATFLGAVRGRLILLQFLREKLASMRGPNATSEIVEQHEIVAQTASFALACVGVYSQLWSKTPFFMKVVLLPLAASEMALSALISL